MKFGSRNITNKAHSKTWALSVLPYSHGIRRVYEILKMTKKKLQNSLKSFLDRKNILVHIEIVVLNRSIEGKTGEFKKIAHRMKQILTTWMTTARPKQANLEASPH